MFRAFLSIQKYLAINCKKNPFSDCLTYFTYLLEIIKQKVEVLIFRNQ